MLSLSVTHLALVATAKCGMSLHHHDATGAGTGDAGRIEPAPVVQHGRGLSLDVHAKLSRLVSSVLKPTAQVVPTGVAKQTACTNAAGRDGIETPAHISIETLAGANRHAAASGLEVPAVAVRTAGSRMICVPR